MSTVLITGANGFIGSVLCKELSAANFNVKGAVRHLDSYAPHPEVKVAEINGRTQWQEALIDIDIVVHLAARAHIIKETASNPNELYLNVNVEGTKNLARQAVAAGVKRFIYISSIKVHGEHSESPIYAAQTPNPKGAYAKSKWEAEQALEKIAAETGLEVVIIRPPLVYGPRVKGNFLRLLQLVEKGWPLPFAGILNKRSMVSVYNLCDLIKICITHPKAPGQIFLVSDNNDLSTPELLNLMRTEFKQSVKLISIPVSWLSNLAKTIGKEGEMQRLSGSLQVDISNTTKILSWLPPYTVQQGIQKTAEWFLLVNKSNAK